MSLGELFPIQAKGAVKRLTFKGVPTIETNYHKAMEQGRVLESSVTDAIFQLQAKKKDLMEKIQTYFDLNKLAIHGKNKLRIRAPLYSGDSAQFLQTIAHFQQDVIKIISAITTNIGKLQSIEQNMLRMLQEVLNAIAALLHEICNWGIPDLPAIPNLFSDTLWKWNGFNFFPLSAFKPNIGFDFNFAFKQCVIHTPNLNIFRNYPTHITTEEGLQYGTPVFVPPLGGIIGDTTQYPVPGYLDQTAIPVYDPNTFNPNTSMLGSVPDPTTIFSDYQMPAQTYEDNIVSIVPTTRDQVVEPSDPDYSAPDLAVRNPELRKALIRYINLDNVVESNFDPYVTSAWLFYLNRARIGRRGNWLLNLQLAYNEFVVPSVVALQNNDVPWNTHVTGMTVSTPTDIPLLDTLLGLKDSDPVTYQNILWKLSYIEAGILGYTRTQNYDAGADATYLSTFTAAEVDYQATPIDATKTTTIILGQGQAQFPVECTFPTDIATVLNQVITKASQNIVDHPEFRTTRPQFRFVYDAFAQAKEVDRFSQFWREFNFNLTQFLTQDPYVVGFVTTYVEALDSAINPLGADDIYIEIKTDANSRDRSWTPGSPLLAIPVAPILTFVSGSTPDASNNGWHGDELDVTAFLARPDIQAQPIPIQIAMLRTNLSYAGIKKFQSDMQTEIADTIQQAQALLADFQNIGFHVIATGTTAIPPSGTQAVDFAQIDFDNTGNVTTPSTFTIQQSGTYALTGNLKWGAGDPGVRTVTIFKGVTPVFTASTDPLTSAPTDLAFATALDLVQGEVISVQASHDLGVSQTVIAGSELNCIRYTNSETSSTQTSTGSQSGTKSFLADVSFPKLTAVSVQSDGNVIPIDPTTTAPNVTPFTDGIALDDATSGSPVLIGMTFGAVYNVPGANFTPGALIYAGLNGLATQDYATLITQVRFVCYIGKAVDTETFIFEPHVPSQFAGPF
jgi:hypothetical protein